MDIGPKINNCAICLFKLENDVMVKLNCNHKFHKNCIVAWARTSKICPLCRFDNSKQIVCGFTRESRSNNKYLHLNTILLNQQIINDYELCFIYIVKNDETIQKIDNFVNNNDRNFKNMIICTFDEICFLTEHTFFDAYYERILIENVFPNVRHFYSLNNCIFKRMKNNEENISIYSRSITT